MASAGSSGKTPEETLRQALVALGSDRARSIHNWKKFVEGFLGPYFGVNRALFAHSSAGLVVYEQSPSADRDALLAHLIRIMPNHYMSPERRAERVARLGLESTAKMLQDRIPSRNLVMSGEMGEIFATEFIEDVLDVRVPIRKLRHKDGRNNPLRNDDVVGVHVFNGTIRFVKTEAKSYRSLRTAVMLKAQRALTANHGQPGRDALVFISEQLDFDKDADLRHAIEDYLDKRLRSKTLRLMFLLFGSASADLVENYFASATLRGGFVVAGVKVEGHGNLIADAFKALVAPGHHLK